MEEIPVVIKAYDILEFNGEDVRQEPFESRRNLLENWFVSLDKTAPFHLSKQLTFENWEELAEKREEARSIGSEGLMLKHKHSPYKSGRKKGDWWKWKVDPFTVDGVLIYAQQGHGRRSNLFTDYTFAVWNEEGKLIPFTKAYSGLKDKEFREITQFVKQNTLDRYGPVRAVEPELVFEIAFEGIAPSNRHKSGIALRFPRMKRWRRDKPASEANTLEDLYTILEQYEHRD
jgi:DNA ligase-1